MEAVFIENDVIRAGVLAGTGADNLRADFEPEDVDVLRRRPNRIVNPHRGVLSAAALRPDAGYPWYGATYTLGLEPFSSVRPDFESAHREGTTLSPAPGASKRTAIDATLSGLDDRGRTGR